MTKVELGNEVIKKYLDAYRANTDMYDSFEDFLIHKLARTEKLLEHYMSFYTGLHATDKPDAIPEDVYNDCQMFELKPLSLNKSFALFLADQKAKDNQ